MNHWFVAYSYRKHEDAPIRFGNLVCSTIDNIFSFAHVSQGIADEHQYSDVQIINWKKMEEIEFMAHKAWTNESKIREVLES